MTLSGLMINGNKFANDLVELQALYPEPTGVFDNEFKDWDGSTGMHLPHNEAVACMATAVYRLHKGVNFS